MTQLPTSGLDTLGLMSDPLVEWTEDHVRFADRRDAGRRLGAALSDLMDQDPVVVGISPDGMPVAAEVARALDASLDMISSAEVLEASGERARHEFGGYYPRHRQLAVVDRTVVLVDDGLVSSARAQVAARRLRARDPAHIVLAVPVASASSVGAMSAWVDEVVCLEYRDQPWALRFSYDDFGRTSEREVAAVLSGPTRVGVREVMIEVPSEKPLTGRLTVPRDACPRGVTLIARDSGSTGPHTQGESLAAALNEAGLATLLLDLVAPGEQVEPMDAFALEAMSQRLVAATNWLRSQPETALCALGYFGEGSGSAAVLVTAAKLRAGVAAVVSCGGRADAAKSWLGQIVAPVLLITRDPDAASLRRTREVRGQLKSTSDLAVISRPVRATRGTDPNTRVSRLAVDWLTRHSYELAAASDALRVVILCRKSAARSGDSPQITSTSR